MKAFLVFALSLFASFPALAVDNWRLCSRLENGQETSMLQYNMTMRFENGGAQVSGNSGCNMYWGDVVEKPEFSFEYLRVTQRACLDENGRYDEKLMRAEELFIKDLNRARNMQLSENSLVILGDRTELRFAPEGSCQ